MNLYSSHYCEDSQTSLVCHSSSVLNICPQVRTGVFRGGANSETDPAQIVVDDVEAAVTAGLHCARSMRWHSMR